MEDEPQRIVDLLESIWRSIDELCASLEPGDWEKATDCPGWTVKDQLSHIIGTESMLAGKPAPEHKVEPKPYVKNRIGEFNEVHVDYRRPIAPEQVLEEFRRITTERLSQLRSMSDADFQRQTMTPVGPDTYLEFMKIRAFDCWVHEQDIRRAVGRPGNLSGKAARHAVGRCFLAMPYVVGKKAGAPEGSVVVFEVAYSEEVSQPREGRSSQGGDAALDRLAVAVKEGRGVAVPEVPAEPFVVVGAGVEPYVAACCGRVSPSSALESGAIRVSGDDKLGRAVVENLAFMI